jgi:hypothetical protein
VLECGQEGAERRGGWDGGRRLLNALGRVVDGKRGRQGGSGGGRHVEDGNGKERGGTTWDDRHRPPASGHGRRHCCVIVEGGGARAADGWDQAIAGPGGQRLGAGGRGSAAWR